MYFEFELKDDKSVGNAVCLKKAVQIIPKDKLYYKHHDDPSDPEELGSVLLKEPHDMKRPRDMQP